MRLWPRIHLLNPLAAILPDPIQIELQTARRFALSATGLMAPVDAIGPVLDHLGFVQIDPLNVCGRMPEHILRHRVANYAQGDLHQHLYGLPDDASLAQPCLPAERRTAFEHFHPGRQVLAAFPVAAWPYFRTAMARRTRSPGRWMGQLTVAENRAARHILATIARQGALGSLHLVDDTRSSNGWTTARRVKVVMDKLLGHGRLLIARRHKGRRIYDLPERILPREILARPAPPPAEVTRWIARLKLRQHRLVTLKRAELTQVRDEVQPLNFDAKGPVYCLRSDLPRLEAARSAQPPLDPRLLAPLDPLIIDRALVKRLWSFDYTWEVYTAAARRQRGYYALPLLAGDELVGDVDLRADRPAGRLRVVSRRVARGHRSRAAVAALARFLKLK